MNALCRGSKRCRSGSGCVRIVTELKLTLRPDHRRPKSGTVRPCARNAVCLFSRTTAARAAALRSACIVRRAASLADRQWPRHLRPGSRQVHHISTLTRAVNPSLAPHRCMGTTTGLATARSVRIALWCVGKRVRMCSLQHSESGGQLITQKLQTVPAAMATVPVAGCLVPASVTAP
jgi:hypothetical protein